MSGFNQESTAAVAAAAAVETLAYEAALTLNVRHRPLHTAVATEHDRGFDRLAIVSAVQALDACDHLM